MLADALEQQVHKSSLSSRTLSLTSASPVFKVTPMQMWHFKSQKQFVHRLAGGVAATALTLAAATSQGGFFEGEFAQSQWVLGGTPGASVEWIPTVNPTSVTIKPVENDPSSFTTFSLLPVVEDYRVTFRTTFFQGQSTLAALQMVVTGNPNPILLGQTGDPNPMVTSLDVIVGSGGSISFLLLADTPPGKDDVPYFVIDQWDVQVIPEASTWIAAVGLLSVCGFQVWRSRNGKRSEAAAVPA
jgi:hypothetical protein